MLYKCGTSFTKLSSFTAALVSVILLKSILKAWNKLTKDIIEEKNNANISTFNIERVQLYSFSEIKFVLFELRIKFIFYFTNNLLLIGNCLFLALF